MLNAVEAQSRRYWQGYTLVLLWFLRIESPRMSCETSRSVDQRQRVTLARRSLDGTRSLQLAQTRHSRNLLADVAAAAGESVASSALLDLNEDDH
jgi:hypothetical protein